MESAKTDKRERLNATLEETAEYLKLSRRTVQLYQERGLLKPIRFGKLRRFRWKEIKELEKNGVE